MKVLQGLLKQSLEVKAVALDDGRLPCLLGDLWLLCPAMPRFTEDVLSVCVNLVSNDPAAQRSLASHSTMRKGGLSHSCRVSDLLDPLVAVRLTLQSLFLTPHSIKLGEIFLGQVRNAHSLFLLSPMTVL